MVLSELVNEHAYTLKQSHTMLTYRFYFLLFALLSLFFGALDHSHNLFVFAIFTRHGGIAGLGRLSWFLWHCVTLVFVFEWCVGKWLCLSLLIYYGSLKLWCSSQMSDSRLILYWLQLWRQLSHSHLIKTLIEGLHVSHYVWLDQTCAWTDPYEPHIKYHMKPRVLI